MAVIINGDTGIDKITDGSVVNADIASGIDAAKLTGTLPAIDGSSLTGISSYADSDALSLFNVSGSAPVYACRAWVNFRGNSTVTIRASGNVSSVTDNSTGNYTVNFTTAMADANYAAPFASGDDTISDMIAGVGNYTTTSLRVTTRNGANSNIDTTYISVAIFR